MPYAILPDLVPDPASAYITWVKPTETPTSAGPSRSPSQSADLQAKGRKKEWVVTFRNESAADPAKRVLYVLLAENGDYIAANHSGR